jgi:hypothetical protein
MAKPFICIMNFGEGRGGEGRGRGRLFPFCGLVALLAKLTQFGLHVKH